MLPCSPVPLLTAHIRRSLAAVAHAVQFIILGSTATAHIHHECAISRPCYNNTCWPGIQAKVYGKGSAQGWP